MVFSRVLCRRSGAVTRRPPRCRCAHASLTDCGGISALFVGLLCCLCTVVRYAQAIGDGCGALVVVGQPRSFVCQQLVCSGAAWQRPKALHCDDAFALCPMKLLLGTVSARCAVPCAHSRALRHRARGGRRAVCGAAQRSVSVSTARHCNTHVSLSTTHTATPSRSTDAS